MSVASRVLVVLIAAAASAVFAATVDAAPCCMTLVPPPPPPPREGANVSYGAAYAQVGIVIARDSGLFRSVPDSGPFRGVKIQVDVRQQADLQNAISEVSRSVGVVGVGPINALAQFAARGDGRIYVIATLVARPDYALFARATAPENVAWLKGQRIAIPSAGSLAHLYTVRALSVKGLNWKDVTFVVTDPKQLTSSTTAWQTLSQGDFAAAPLSAQLTQTGMTAPFKPVIGPEAITMPTWVLYVGQATLEREARELGRFVQGIEAGVKQAKSEPAQAAKALEMLGVVGPMAAFAAKLLPVMLPDSVRPNVVDVQETVRLMTEIGVLKETPTLADETSIGKVFNLR